MVTYYAVTVFGRRIALPKIDMFEGARQIGGGMPEQDERMTFMARAIYGDILERVERDVTSTVWEKN